MSSNTSIKYYVSCVKLIMVGEGKKSDVSFNYKKPLRYVRK